MTDKDYSRFDQVYDTVIAYFKEAQQAFDQDPESGEIGETLGGVVVGLCDWLCSREEIQKCGNDVIDQIRAAVAEELGDRARDMNTQQNAPVSGSVH